MILNPVPLSQLLMLMGVAIGHVALLSGLKFAFRKREHVSVSLACPSPHCSCPPRPFLSSQAHLLTLTPLLRSSAQSIAIKIEELIPFPKARAGGSQPSGLLPLTSASMLCCHRCSVATAALLLAEVACLDPFFPV